jgi:hypothetical protein
MVRRFDSIELRNPGSGAVVTLPKDATPAEIAKARKQLRPDEDSIYDVPAKDVVARMYGSEAPKSDKPLPVPTTPGILARKRAAENAEYAAKIQAERDRTQKLADDRRIAELTAEKLAERMASQPEKSEPAPAADDPWSWEAVLARADAAAQHPHEGGSNAE